MHLRQTSIFDCFICLDLLNTIYIYICVCMCIQVHIKHLNIGKSTFFCNFFEKVKLLYILDSCRFSFYIFFILMIRAHSSNEIEKNIYIFFYFFFNEKSSITKY